MEVWAAHTTRTLPKTQATLRMEWDSPVMIPVLASRATRLPLLLLLSRLSGASHRYRAHHHQVQHLVYYLMEAFHEVPFSMHYMIPCSFCLVLHAALGFGSVLSGPVLFPFMFLLTLWRTKCLHYTWILLSSVAKTRRWCESIQYITKFSRIAKIGKSSSYLHTNGNIW